MWNYGYKYLGLRISSTQPKDCNSLLIHLEMESLIQFIFSLKTLQKVSFVVKSLTWTIGFNKAIVSCNFCYESWWLLRSSCSIWTIEIHLNQSKFHAVSKRPFKIIQKAPSNITFNIALVNFNSFQNIVNVMFVIIDSQQIIQIAQVVTNSIFSNNYRRIVIRILDPIKNFSDSLRCNF